MQECRSITRKSASNLALAFVLLPKAKRLGMAALYAFCREVDDVVDEETASVAERRARLDAWSQDVARACRGERPVFEVNREFQPVIARYRLPLALFEELLQGVAMDLDITRYATYRDLELYCYRVASVVGLLSLEIFGYQNPRCRRYAEALGKALQFTNILRDVGLDARRGRIYLPLEALARHGVREEEILREQYSPRFAALAAEVAGHAREFYRQARETLPPEDRRAMAAAELMGSVYWRLLRKLEQNQFRVFGPHPTRLSKGHKLALIVRTYVRAAFGAVVPNYGTP